MIASSMVTFEAQPGNATPLRRPCWLLALRTTALSPFLLHSIRIRELSGCLRMTEIQRTCERGRMIERSIYMLCFFHNVLALFHNLAFLEFLHITIAELRIRKHQANPTELTLTTLAPQSEEETQRRLEPDMLPRKGWYQQTCLTKLR